jgi:hypothetical protein
MIFLFNYLADSSVNSIMSYNSQSINNSSHLSVQSNLDNDYISSLPSSLADEHRNWYNFYVNLFFFPFLFAIYYNDSI